MQVAILRSWSGVMPERETEAFLTPPARPGHLASMSPLESRSGGVPLRALFISLAALAVPVIGALFFPDALGEYGALLWLVLLIPAFLLAYHKGWRGAATALAAGMATLSITHAVVSASGGRVPDLLFGIVVAYLAISLGIGWMAEILHRDRSEVEEMAFTDQLTGLPNRRHARVFLENEFAAAQRGRPLSVVLFDLDRFKDYNDTYGHPAGDEALREFAGVLENTTRRMNLCARFGGEEFIAILAGSDAIGAMVFADRVRTSLRSLGLGDQLLTCSGGVADFHPGMTTPDQLLAAADGALYEAKLGGRDSVYLYKADGESVAASEARTEDRAPNVRHPAPVETLSPHQISRFGEGRSVLVVEDESQVREVIATFLKREGFDVVEANDVPSGISHLTREFDVVVTDLRLPGASGHEVVSAVKSRWPDTPVIVITGIFDAQVAADALHAGADRYLFKPFGMPDLRNHLIDSLARRDRLQREADALGELDVDARERAEAARNDVLRGALSLVRAVEVRDPYTRGHSRRVASLASRIAEAIDPGGAMLPRERLELACELHDVGKIGVPDVILNKSEALTPAELAKIREHPRVGRRILEPMLKDPLILGVVSWHHERWDGAGYPDGLNGEDIPLGARIVALADALAAMTHPRAHREALPWDRVVREMLAGSGTLFDPAVVNAANRVLDQLGEICSAPLAEPGFGSDGEAG